LRVEHDGRRRFLSRDETRIAISDDAKQYSEDKHANDEGELHDEFLNREVWWKASGAGD
jgi:hypothetical protein